MTFRISYFVGCHTLIEKLNYFNCIFKIILHFLFPFPPPTSPKSLNYRFFHFLHIPMYVHISIQKPINKSCWVDFCYLCEQDFRVNCFALDKQHGGLTLGNGNSVSQSINCLYFLCRVKPSKIPTFHVPCLLIFLLLQSYLCSHF